MLTIQPSLPNMAKTSMTVQAMSVSSSITTIERGSWLLKTQDGVIQITENGPLATYPREWKTRGAV